MENYPVKLLLRIDWSDMDLFGHVNNVAYARFVQSGRVNYWEKTGLSQLYVKKKIGPILASTHIDFKAPLHYPGNIVVETGMEKIMNTSFVLRHRILDEHGRAAAEAKDVIVVFDFNKGEKVLFPNELKTEIEMLEGKKI